MVSFTSLTFIFRFLPIFFLVYYLVPANWKKLCILVGSIVFYAVGEPIFILLLLALTGINYYLGKFGFRRIGPISDSKLLPGRGKYLFAAITLDIFVLILFKCLSTFVDSSLLPLGLSFYIFKMISYQVDTYRQVIDVEPKFTECAVYFMMFPQICQGPIMRYEDSELYNAPKLSLESIEDGLKYFIIGLGMKVIIADRIGILFNDLGMYGYQSISTPLAWMGAFAYTFELYFDFWGYSLMASGLFVAMGYNHIVNFDQPYSSKTISEFYRRWHITLGAFFRDYVYIPLGGSRVNKPRLVVNLAIVWILTGIWHGNGWNFVIWGAVLGIFIILEKLFYSDFMNRIPLVGNLYVLFVIPLTWVIFAINDLEKLGIYFGRLFPVVQSSAVVDKSDYLRYLNDYWYLFMIAIVLCVPEIQKFYERHKKNPITVIILLAVFWISIYFSAGSAGNPFMYLNF